MRPRLGYHHHGKKDSDASMASASANESSEGSDVSTSIDDHNGSSRSASSDNISSGSSSSSRREHKKWVHVRERDETSPLRQRRPAASDSLFHENCGARRPMTPPSTQYRGHLRYEGRRRIRGFFYDFWERISPTWLLPKRPERHYAPIWKSHHAKHSIVCRAANVCLAGALTLYIVSIFWQIHYHRPVQHRSKSGLTIRERVQLRRPPPPPLDSSSTLTRRVTNAALTVMGRPPILNVDPYAVRKKDAESLSPNCTRPSWQMLSFPTCNDLHALDLHGILMPNRSANRTATTLSSSKYLSSGLWRDVWAWNEIIELHHDAEFNVVIKMMKPEHEVDMRNLERHRRDAVTMERLSAHRNIVDMYAFCGNTVITEYIATSLDDIIADSKQGVQPYNATGHQKLSRLPAIHRGTPHGRLTLALQCARGLAALHEMAIVHADVTAQQFLVRPDGTVALNDFNRCRFLSQHDSNSTPCPLYIPTAPGKARAPEEYAYERLNEKIDVFSVANVYYMILTGATPWDGVFVSDVKNILLNKKQTPSIPAWASKPSKTDAVLANLTEQAYELDPTLRVSAAELVRALERMAAGKDDTSSAA